MTHPFHPLAGPGFVFTALRQTWGEDPVFFYGEKRQTRLLAVDSAQLADGRINLDGMGFTDSDDIVAALIVYRDPDRAVVDASGGSPRTRTSSVASHPLAAQNRR